MHALNGTHSVRAQQTATPHRSWWGVVAAGALISAATAPGQTAGLSPLTDPLIAELGISRTDISFSYLLGTLAGAVALPFIGRAVDRWGARKVILVAVTAFALALLGLSFVSDIYGLTAGFVILRMAGQGTLTLAATTAVVKTIEHRRGLAIGLVSAIGSAGISLTPILVERLVSNGGIALAWRIQSIAVLVIVLPMILLLPRHPARAPTATTGTPDHPAAGNQPPPIDQPTGPSIGPSSTALAHQEETERPEPALSAGWSAKEAARTPIFWVIAAALAATGMLSTALAFHQISILTTQGLSTAEAAANFIPQTITAILATLIVGAIAHKLDPRYALTGSMALLAAALCFLPLITGFGLAVVYGLILGAASGAIRAIEPIALAHYYGTESIGSIRGVITSINVGSTALGPILFSIGRDITGTYTAPSLIAAVIPITVGIVAILCPTPIGAGHTGAKGARPEPRNKHSVRVKVPRLKPSMDHDDQTTSIDSPPWSSAALEAEDTHLVHLPIGVIEALGRGDLQGARTSTEAVLTEYLVAPECLDMWRKSSQQLAITPGDTRWLARLIVDYSAQRTVGCAGFYGPPDPSGVVEIGCSVDPEYRRRGYARAALVILLDKADALPDIRTIRIRVSIDDQVYRRLLTQYGFVDVGEQQDDRGGRVTIFERTIPSHPYPSKPPQEKGRYDGGVIGKGSGSIRESR